MARTVYSLFSPSLFCSLFHIDRTCCCCILCLHIIMQPFALRLCRSKRQGEVAPQSALLFMHGCACTCAYILVYILMHVLGHQVLQCFHSSQSATASPDSRIPECTLSNSSNFFAILSCAISKSLHTATL